MSDVSGFSLIGRRNAAKIKRAIDGESIAIDMAVADAVFQRLSLPEEGFIARQLKIAATTPNPSDAQVALLAVFAYRGQDHV